MNKKQLIEKLNKFDNSMEYQESENKPNGWYSFKMDVIGKTEEYEVMSDALRNSDLAHSDWSYTFLSDAITVLLDLAEGLDDNLKDEDLINEFKDVMDDSFYEQLPEYVYTWEHTSLIEDASWLVDDVISEWGVRNDVLPSAFRYGQERYTYDYARAIVDSLSE